MAADGGSRPGRLTGTDLKEYAELTGTRKKIVDAALSLSRGDTWIHYRFGSAEPKSGGLDCSGAVYFILREAGLKPERSSAAQFEWVKNRGALTIVPESATSLGDAAFAGLKPGDLLFWSGTYEPTDGRKVPISHVQIFLGHETSTGAAVMAGASDGRTYRGSKREGYGVFDFKLPKRDSKGKFEGYGIPIPAQ